MTSIFYTFTRVAGTKALNVLIFLYCCSLFTNSVVYLFASRIRACTSENFSLLLVSILNFVNEWSILHQLNAIEVGFPLTD